MMACPFLDGVALDGSEDPVFGHEADHGHQTSEADGNVKGCCKF
jgi:hypothetical protein